LEGRFRHFAERFEKLLEKPLNYPEDMASYQNALAFAKDDPDRMYPGWNGTELNTADTDRILRQLAAVTVKVKYTFKQILKTTTTTTTTTTTNQQQQPHI
jgi:hypothetical protein